MRATAVAILCLVVSLTPTRASAPALPAGSPEADRPIYVLFTVDVESMSGGGPERYIWGRLPNEPQAHGIGKMMDIFDGHGVQGTFFVNIYEAPRSGQQAMAEVCRRIHDRGHDLELHTHPKPMFGVAYMQHTDLARQREILQRGAELIKQWAGVDVVAHRAGGYMANRDTIKACALAGIPMEFSYNVAWPASALAGSGLTGNAPFVRDGVLCVPVTAYIQAAAGPWRSMRFLDIEASSPAEVRNVVGDLRRRGVTTAVIMMHSFSFSRFGRPNLRVEAALDELLAGFTADPDVKVLTARQLYDIWRADPDALNGADFLPYTGWWMTYCRAWQCLGEGWKNAAVAFAPPAGAGMLAAVTAVIWWTRRKRLAGKQVNVKP